MPIRHRMDKTSRQLDICLELKEKVRTGDINLRVINIHSEFQAIGLKSLEER